MSLMVPTRVEGDGGLGDDRPARLGRHAGVDAGVAAAPTRWPAPLGDRRRLLALDVGDAEPAADRQLGQARPRAPTGRRPRWPGGRSRPRRPGCRCGCGRRPARRPASPGPGSPRAPASPEATPKPNFESTWPVRTNSWVWASTPGVTRTSTFGHEAVLGVERGQPVELVEAVDDDAADAGRARGPRARSSDLLLPCSTSRSAGTPAARATCSSPPVATSRCRPSSCDEPGHGHAQERLGRVGDAVAEGGDRLPAARPQVGLVVDEQRRAELARPARARRTRRPSGGRRRRPRRCRAAAAGAAAPAIGRVTSSRARDAEQVEPDGQPDAGASTSHSRAWVSSGGTSPMT